MIFKVKRGELKALCNFQEVLVDANLIESTSTVFKDALAIAEKTNKAIQIEIPDEVIRQFVELMDRDQLEEMLGQFNEKMNDFSNLTVAQIHSLPIAKRASIPIKSEEDLQMAKEDHPLDILTRPVETNTYGVVSSSLYKKYAVLVAANIDKNGKPLKIYDIRVPYKPEIRLDDLTEVEIDASSRPWRYNGHYRFERHYTLAEARKSMLETFEEYYQDQLKVNSNPDQWDQDSLWRKEGVPAFSDNKWRGRDEE